MPFGKIFDEVSAPIWVTSVLELHNIGLFRREAFVVLCLARFNVVLFEYDLIHICCDHLGSSDLIVHSLYVLLYLSLLALPFMFRFELNQLVQKI